MPYENHPFQKLYLQSQKPLLRWLTIHYFPYLTFRSKLLQKFFSLFRTSFPSFIMLITGKLLEIKDFFTIALFSKFFPFFIGGGRVHDSEVLFLFLIDAGVVKRMNIKLKLGNWSNRVHEGPCSEANTSQFRFSLKCLVQTCLIFSSNVSSQLYLTNFLGPSLVNYIVVAFGSELSFWTINSFFDNMNPSQILSTHFLCALCSVLI